MARADSNGCANLECKNGVTPGLIVIGGGKNGAPLIQNGVMAKTSARYGWVRCPVCRPDEKDPPFKPKGYTKEQIMERARWADAKAPYVQETESRLRKVAAATPTPRALAPTPDNSEQLAELSGKISGMAEALSKSVMQNMELTSTVGKLSSQVAELLAENARLRTAPQETNSGGNPPSGSPPAPKKRKSRQIAKPS
jgi:hypothetical protein